MKNILVAYDGGQPAHRALEAAVELAKRFDASLAVVSVVPYHPGRSPIDPWDDGPTHAQQLAEAGEKEGNSVVPPIVHKRYMLGKP